MASKLKEPHFIGFVTCYNTILTGQIDPHSSKSSLPINTLPFIGLSNPARIDNRVVFPLPEGPTIAVSFPI